jgi:hypothetical protein
MTELEQASTRANGARSPQVETLTLSAGGSIAQLFCEDRTTMAMIMTDRVPSPPGRCSGTQNDEGLENARWLLR